jgi:hypothetical protein
MSLLTFKPTARSGTMGKLLLPLLLSFGFRTDEEKRRRGVSKSPLTPQDNSRPVAITRFLVVN